MLVWCIFGILFSFFFFFFNDTATTEIYTLSLHDALPIWARQSSPVLPLRFPKSAVRLSPIVPLITAFSPRRRSPFRSVRMAWTYWTVDRSWARTTTTICVGSSFGKALPPLDQVATRSRSSYALGTNAAGRPSTQGERS